MHGSGGVADHKVGTISVLLELTQVASNKTSKYFSQGHGDGINQEAECFPCEAWGIQALQSIHDPREQES